MFPWKKVKPSQNDTISPTAQPRNDTNNINISGDNVDADANVSSPNLALLVSSGAVQTRLPPGTPSCDDASA